MSPRVQTGLSPALRSHVRTVVADATNPRPLISSDNALIAPARILPRDNRSDQLRIIL